jgi:hypothetical protein
MSTTSAVAIVVLAAGLGTAEASDLKTLVQDVMPCKAAAVRLCDRSQGITYAAMWTCGATLASQREKVGARCLEVLRRYGQL